jgi:hypothetical protein
VLETAKRKIFEGGALQWRSLKFLTARRGALSVRSAPSITVALARSALPARALWALTLTTGTRGQRRRDVTRCVKISGRRRSGFPYDLADRDRLGLAGYVLFAFVLVHALVLVGALVLTGALILVDGRRKWRDSAQLAMVFNTFAGADR